MPGIGEKTATALIVQYGSIENAYAHVEEIKPPRASANLKEHYELAQMSKTLATIDIHAEISYELPGQDLRRFPRYIRRKPICSVKNWNLRTC